MASNKVPKRVPKVAELREMEDSELKAAFCSEETSALHRTVYEREMVRREKLSKREAEIEDGLPNCFEEPELYELEKVRKVVRFIVQDFAEGATTASAAAWAISQAVKVSYKWGERLLEGGYEYHLISGVEERSGVQAAEQRRHLIHPVSAEAWKIFSEGSLEDWGRFGEDPTSLIPSLQPKKKAQPEESAVPDPEDDALSGISFE
jgi:hypothetical protein